MRKFSVARCSRVNACTIRMPAMSSASVAVTSPSRSRTDEYARAERERKSALADDHERDHDERREREPPVEARTGGTAVPLSSSVLCASVVTPSVTSWSIASTSFVIRLISTPARFRS